MKESAAVSVAIAAFAEHAHGYVLTDREELGADEAMLPSKRSNGQAPLSPGKNLD
jgi:hypothetical protein